MTAWILEFLYKEGTAHDDDPTIDQASRFPFSGNEVVIGGKRRACGYLRLYVRPYSIYYRVIDEKIVVMRVLHERMDAGAAIV